MRIGIGIRNQVRNVRSSVVPGWASRAEAAGFSTLGTVGRIAYPGLMDTVALAAAASATSRIGLLTHILPAPAWPAEILAKEAAGIDGVSDGRLTLGIGLGGRDDDFVVPGLGPRGLGERLDGDLETYRRVWDGELVGGVNPAVPAGTRRIPLLFGGKAAATYTRMARWGAGYVAGTLPAPMVAESFEAARAAWRDAGRTGSPRLVAVAYFALGDGEQGRTNVRDYYAVNGAERAGFIASTLADDSRSLKDVVKSFDAVGADELILAPALDDVGEIGRLADVVL